MAAVSVDRSIGCKHDMFWRQTFEVWSRRLLSTSFVFAQQNKLFFVELLEVKNNFWRQACCFWAENMPESWEKWNRGWTCWSKTCKQLTFGGTVCFNGCQTQMFADKTCHVWPPIRTRFFVSSPRLDATDGNFLFNAGFYSAKGSVIGNLNNIN